jgi:N-acetylmuramoyl-L-alanine amidase
VRRWPAALAVALLTLTACQSPSTSDPSPVRTTQSPARTTERFVPDPATPSISVTQSHTRAVRGSLSGKVIVLDPGHNPGNAAQPTRMNHLVDAGGFLKACDTSGTSTDGGYPESLFTLDVAQHAAADLRQMGATVVLTRDATTPFGPCITARAAIGNRAHAQVAVSIHADGGPASGAGFHVIVPVPVSWKTGNNSPIVAPSRRLALDLRGAFRSVTGEPFANYVGQDGLAFRGDLGGLNLSQVPKVFIECANMRNAVDAARVTDPSWRADAAQGVADGIALFLQQA